MKQFFIIIICLFQFSILSSQHTSDSLQATTTVNGYVDVFYAHDFNNPTSLKRSYSSNPYRVNQFGLGYAYIEVASKGSRIESKIALNYGGIVDVMYVNEPLLYKFIREASLTFKVNDRFQISGGVMPALFGFETFINSNNMHATRAVMCDFAPDFAAGITLSYKLSHHWTNKFQINNGWQVIAETNKNKGIANVLIYENEANKNMYNFGLFYVNEAEINHTKQPRFYSNNFAKLHYKNWVFAPMFDYGIQKKGDLTENNVTNKEWLSWYSAGLSIRYGINKNYGVALRYERTIDKYGIVPEIKTHTPNGFQMDGLTLTLEYLKVNNCVVRLEARYNNNIDGIYESEDGTTLKKSDLFSYLSAAYKF